MVYTNKDGFTKNNVYVDENGLVTRYDKKREEINLNVERGQIEYPNVETDIKEGEVGYIKLRRFSRDINTEFTQKREMIL